VTCVFVATCGWAADGLIARVWGRFRVGWGSARRALSVVRSLDVNHVALVRRVHPPHAGVLDHKESVRHDEHESAPNWMFVQARYWMVPVPGTLQSLSVLHPALWSTRWVAPPLSRYWA
jgi:hypothetical protein